MDLSPALASARISFIEPDLLAAEDGIPASVQRELRKRGHRLRGGGLAKGR